MAGVHSLYSPSSAERWLRCSKSLDYTQSTTNTASEEGTMLHLVAYLCGKYGISEDAFLGFKHYIETREYEVSDDHLEILAPGLEYISAHRRHMLVGFEEKVNLGSILPDQFGTVDFYAYDGHTLTVIDWKFGRVPVLISRNEQMMLYGYGIWDRLGRPKDIDIVLVCLQPRVTFSPKTYELTVAELEEFGEKVSKHYKKEERSAEPGRVQCLYCPGKKLCGAYSEYIWDMLEGIMETPVGQLTIAQKAKIILNKKLIENAIKDIEEDLKVQYNQGVVLPGLKMVEGAKGKKVFTDVAKVVSILRPLIDKGEVSKAAVYKDDLRTPTQILKALGSKTPEELTALIHQPQNSPKLVSVDEDGKIVNTVASLFDDF